MFLIVKHKFQKPIKYGSHDVYGGRKILIAKILNEYF